MIDVCPSDVNTLDFWLTFAFKIWKLFCSPALPSLAVSFSTMLHLFENCVEDRISDSYKESN